VTDIDVCATRREIVPAECQGNVATAGVLVLQRQIPSAFALPVVFWGERVKTMSGVGIAVVLASSALTPLRVFAPMVLLWSHSPIGHI